MSNHSDYAFDEDDRPIAIERRSPSHSRSRYWGEWAGILVAAVIIAFVLRTFVFQTFWIPSESMEDTLLIGDRVIVNKLAYEFSDIERGDIVVFHRPPGVTDPATNDLIKRVIGLPGETVESREGSVYVNGSKIDEPYTKTSESTNNLTMQTISDGQILVMGDNRANSADGRVFGQISDDLVIGKASLRVWPLDRLTYFSN